MKNLKMSKKLFVAFALIVALGLVSSVIGIFNISNMSDEVDYFTGTAVPGNNVIWTGRRAMVAVERGLYQAASSSNQSEATQFLENAKKESQTIVDYVIPNLCEIYPDLEYVQLYKKAIEQTETVKDKMFKAFENGNTEQGLTILKEEYTPLFVAAAAQLTEINNIVTERINTATDTSKKLLGKSYLVSFAFAAISIAVSIALALKIIKLIVLPLKEIESAAENMSKGILDVNITYESKDEIGMLSDCMREMSLKIKAIINDLSSELLEIANGNLDAKSSCSEIYVGDYSPLKSSMQQIVKDLNFAMSNISTSSQQVNSGAEQVSSAAQALSQGATEQASSVEELSATMEEITGKIKLNAEKAEQVNTISNETEAGVLASNEKMKQISLAMDDITNKSNEISKIIKTIDDIAFQTNILALNAAVEAARAGSAGKGFAVVADEVRNLAQKSAEAAKNTTLLIESTVSAVRSGAILTEETASALIQVTEKSSKIIELISEISAASKEQADGVAQVTLGVEQISAVIQTNSATAQESAAASEELSGQANLLRDLVSRFKLSDSAQNYADTI